jgi:gliding motility-associated-like protein
MHGIANRIFIHILKYPVLYFSFLFTQFAVGQNFDWLKTFGTKTGNEQVLGLFADSNGGVTSFISWEFAAKVKDTLEFDSVRYSAPSNFSPASFFVSKDKTGKVVTAVKAGNYRAANVCKDEFGNYYIVGWVFSGSNSIGSNTLFASNGRILFAKYDKNYKLLWYKQTGHQLQSDPLKIKYSKGHVYFVCRQYGDGFIGNTYYSLSPNGGSVFGELDTANGSIKWSNCLYTSMNATGGLGLVDVVRLNNRLYLLGNTGSEEFKIAKDTFFRYSGFVIHVDLAGNYVRRYCAKSKGNIQNGYSNVYFYTLCDDAKNLYLGGSFVEDFQWGNDTIFSQFSPNSGCSELFIGSIAANLTPRWTFKPIAINTSTKSISSILNSCVNGEFVNFTGSIGANYYFDSSLIQKSNGVFLKFDNIGNLLWVAGNGDTLSSSSQVLSASNYPYVFAGGSFQNSIQFLPHTVTSKGNSDAFIVKISDNTITRGPVSSGPYCAGDTFNIPYTKDGNFDSLNYFIAELSDENGNFDKQIRRLGVLRTNKDSVIRGVLPLFQVQSSPNYRIRIRSTRPAVQSFYKLDTLKLLVYSRDKAYAGKDTAICPGDSISLRTYGGTKWEWSPKQNMQDSTKSSTKVWPTKTTKYRIVISDSSGCGQADTAYKTIILRYPKATLSTTDTTVCKGDTLNLKATFTGGDSTNYNWRWQSKETGGWVNQSAGQNLQTVNWNYAYKQDTAIILRLLLSDGCQRPQDTTEIKVGPKSHLKFTVPTQDTILCAGVPFTAKAKGQGGDAANYQFRWALMPNNTLLSGTDSIRWEPTQNSQLRITLADGCMEKADTQFVNIKVRSTLNAISNLNDSILCYGQNITFSSTGEGGDTTNYQYRWLLDGKTIGNGNTVSIATEAQFSDTGGLKTLKLVLADNCTAKNDTISAEIRVRPKLQVQMQYDSVFCFGEINTLKANGKGGTGIYRFTWYDPSGKQVSTSDSISIKHSDKAITGQKRYLAILSDGCSAPKDSQFVVLNYLKPLSAGISSMDSCLSSNSTLTAFASGGDGNYTYTWFESQIEKGTSKSLNIPLPSTEIQYTLIAKDGCSADSAVASKAVSPYPQIRISSDKDSGCEKLRVQLKAIKQNQTTNEYRYTVGGTRTSWSSDSNCIANIVAGKYMPILEVQTKLGCTDTFQFKTITVHPKPIAAYSHTPARPVPKKPEVQFLNLSTGGVKYQWNFGKFGSSSAFQPKVSMTDTGEQNVYLVAINDKGCTDTSRGTVKVYEDYSALLPTAFTPGADNLNWQFKPEFMGVENYTLSIYNRWGQLLFTAENQGWDGTCNGKAVPEGIYVYTLKITTFTYDKVQEQGVVMVLNN